MEIIPLSDNLGAEIQGIDLRTITDEEFEVIYQAWLDRLILRFRGQSLTDDQLQAFSRRFGPLEKIPIGNIEITPELLKKMGLETPYVTMISNIKKDGRPIGGLGNSEASWHSDMTYVENPPPASILYSVEVPATGGDTHFANQYAAYDAMPGSLKQRVINLGIKHDATHNSVGEMRRGYELVDDPREIPGAVHPIVKTHEETKRKALFMGRRDWAYVPDLPLDESEALLDEIWEYAALPENCWTQQWQVGDVIIWDNRCVLHRRAGFDDNERRLMKRCQVLARD
ncbi:MAG: TauD/TfdA family dioxygenase [Pseudomonadota bacterium]